MVIFHGDVSLPEGIWEIPWYRQWQISFLMFFIHVAEFENGCAPEKCFYREHDDNLWIWGYLVLSYCRTKLRMQLRIWIYPGAFGSYRGRERATSECLIPKTQWILNIVEQSKVHYLIIFIWEEKNTLWHCVLSSTQGVCSWLAAHCMIWSGCDPRPIVASQMPPIPIFQVLDLSPVRIPMNHSSCHMSALLQSSYLKNAMLGCITILSWFTWL